ncbi:MAG TPA: type II secretion system F family protein [Clostridia bacterium]|jgi:tight adherence protein B|nr:hypothetical protein [Clostridiaceae bacterium]HOA30372.1 type II secretion system F family protein [Clostridia bacterium]HPZ52599.1 type II secretion system F family protein [Clostridia bacterium]
MNKTRLVDYKKYVFSFKDWCVFAFVLTAISVMFGLVLFESLKIGIVFSIISSPFVFARLKKYFMRKRLEELERQFCDALQLMSASLSAGLSFTSCISEIASGDLSVDGNLRLVQKEFANMQRLIALNISPEEAVEAFAKRTGSRDIQNFSNALYESLQAGGNLVQLVRNSASALRVKYDSEDEIRSLLNLPRFNHRIMMVMPFVLILMVKAIAPGYVEPLYTEGARWILFLVAFLIILSWYIGERISDIKF